MRGGINRSASKDNNEDGTDSWYKQNFDMGGKEGAEWEVTKGKRTMTKRVRGRRRRKKSGEEI